MSDGKSKRYDNKQSDRGANQAQIHLCIQIIIARNARHLSEEDGVGKLILFKSPCKDFIINDLWLALFFTFAIVLNRLVHSLEVYIF